MTTPTNPTGAITRDKGASFGPGSCPTGEADTSSSSQATAIPSRGPAELMCLNAAAAIEGVAQELDAYGRTAQGHMLRCALDVLLNVQPDEQLQAADAGTRQAVSRAWARFQKGIALAGEAEGQDTKGGLNLKDGGHE